MWVRLDKNVFNFERDVYLGIIYLRPADAKTRDTYFDGLEQDITKYRVLGDIVLSGDFNARTGTAPDFIPNEDDTSSAYIGLPDTYVNDIPEGRNNECGKCLIDMCCDPSLRILNGRFAGDTLGNPTFYSNSGMGTSCVDYTLTYVPLFNRIRYFSIANPDRLISDHCVQRFGLRCTFQDTVTTKSNVRSLFDKFEWGDSGTQLYQRTLLSENVHSKICNFMLKDLSIGTKEANDAVQEITNILVEAGKGSLKLIRRSGGKRNKNGYRKTKLGFDQECFMLRKELRSLGRAVHRNPFNQSIREKFMSASKTYKRLLKKKESDMRAKLFNKLCTLESNNPKEFWQTVDKLKPQTANPVEDIDPGVWLSHFQRLYTTQPDNSLKSEIAQLENSVLKQHRLNKPFSIGEIKKHIKNLKNNKATSCDLTMNEMLKSGASILLPAVCKLFNFVLDSGSYPDQWNITYQVPVFKSGDTTNCDNYRGIAISSCLGKLFTGVLQSRLLQYVEQENKLSQNQAAFRPGRSTVDHVFTIKSLVNKYVKYQKKEL